VDNNTIITIFVVVAAVALVLQMVILFVLYKALRQTSERTAAAILEDAQPKIAEIAANLAETSASVRAHVAQVGEATGEIVERARLQAARLDEFIVNAAHKVEATTELLQHKVFSPMRRVRAIVTALNAGLAFFKSNRPRHRTNGESVEDEEMFI
jgi:hypothetical protein